MAQRDPQPSAAILDSQTLRSTPESGARAGYDAGKKKKGTKVHVAVDTLGHLLALVVTPANERVHMRVNQERDQVAELCRQVQDVTGQNVQLAWVDQGYTGEDAKGAAQEHGIELEVVKVPAGTRGFVLLPRRWVHKRVNAVVGRAFAWASRFRRFARDCEKGPQTLAGLHFLAFACLMLAQAVGHIINAAA